MKFQGSGFSLELPPGVTDASTYVFTFPDLGELPPNISVRFEQGGGVDMKARREAEVSRLRESLPNPEFWMEDKVRSRGDWQYFTNVVVFGEEGMRICLKELQLLISEPEPTLYVFAGTDLSDNWPRFEPTFDALIRGFQPNGIQRIS